MAERAETVKALGMTPFVILEVEPDADADPEDRESPGYQLSIRAGGGIQNKETITALMLQAVAELTGVEIGEFLVIVDTYRRAAGLPSLVDVAFRR